MTLVRGKDIKKSKIDKLRSDYAILWFDYYTEICNVNPFLNNWMLDSVKVNKLIYNKGYENDKNEISRNVYKLSIGKFCSDVLR